MEIFILLSTYMFGYYSHTCLTSLEAQMVKQASAYNAGHPGSVPGLETRKRQPTPVLLPGKSHGQRSLVGYSPWGHKELDFTLATIKIC